MSGYHHPVFTIFAVIDSQNVAKIPTLTLFDIWIFVWTRFFIFNSQLNWIPREIWKWVSQLIWFVQGSSLQLKIQEFINSPINQHFNVMSNKLRTQSPPFCCYTQLGHLGNRVQHHIWVMAILPVYNQYNSSSKQRKPHYLCMLCVYEMKAILRIWRWLNCVIISQKKVFGTWDTPKPRF